MNHLTTFLLGVLDSHANAVRKSDPQTFEAVFREIEVHIDSPELLAIDRLAVLAGLSKSRFQTKFKAEIGIPPSRDWKYELAREKRMTILSRYQ